MMCKTFWLFIFKLTFKIYNFLNATFRYQFGLFGLVWAVWVCLNFSNLTFTNFQFVITLFLGEKAAFGFRDHSQNTSVFG